MWWSSPPVRFDPEHNFLHYRGSIPYADLHATYHAADAFIFASSCENLPNIMIEAMSAGQREGTQLPRRAQRLIHRQCCGNHFFDARERKNMVAFARNREHRARRTQRHHIRQFEPIELARYCVLTGAVAARQQGVGDRPQTA